jgi:hypothetical protein
MNIELFESRRHIESPGHPLVCNLSLVIVRERSIFGFIVPSPDSVVRIGGPRLVGCVVRIGGVRIEDFMWFVLRAAFQIPSLSRRPLLLVLVMYAKWFET